MIELTDIAYEKVVEFAQEFDEPLSVKLAVIISSSGLRETFFYCSNISPEDCVAKIKNIIVFYNRSFAYYFEGKVIDYVDSYVDAGFKVIDINEPSNFSI